MLFDVNLSAGGITQPGWTAVNLAGINGVTFTGVGNVNLLERDRVAANTNGLNGDTANNGMWRDFIFADERIGTTQNVIPNTGPAGINISIANLVANARYDVSLWSWDDASSTTDRSALWNGIAYSFNDSPDPASLDDRVVNFSVMANAQGVAVLEGRIDFSARGECCNVFVNGFSLNQVPEPGSLALAGAALLGLRLQRRRSRHA